MKEKKELFNYKQIIYEREKRTLQLQIDDKTNEIKYLNKEIEQLENENKNLKETIPLDEKSTKEMITLLKSNLKELRKQFEECQFVRLAAENQCNTYVKSMKEKNEIIHNLEKEIKEIKAHNKANNNPNNQPTIINIVKKITGGMNQ